MNIIDDVVKNLRNNPVFHMSLASKELFHSNVLAWLLEYQNIDGLADIFAPCDDKGNKLKDFKVLTVLREKSHLDLIIVFLLKEDYDLIKGDDLVEIKDFFLNSERPQQHNIERLQTIKNHFHFVVVENKFKSIPYPKQLDEYNNTAKICFDIKEPPEDGKRSKTIFHIVLNKEKTTRYLMAPQVALENFKECTEWRRISYENIAQLLSKIKDCTNNNPKDEEAAFTKKFIEYYAKFIENMLELTKDIEGKLSSTDNPAAFPDWQDISKLKKIRIHDFYEKLWFSVLLNRIEITNEDKIYKKAPGYTHALGLLDFKIEGPNHVWYGIQIQNKQLRIVVEPEWGYTWQGKCPETQIIKYCEDILNRMNPQQSCPKQKNLCSFKDFKYKYLLLENNISIKDLASKINKALTAIQESTLIKFDSAPTKNNKNT